MSRRTKDRGLTLSRIYRRGNRYCYFAREPIENPKTGKILKWHTLCQAHEGEDRARELAQELLRHNRQGRDENGELPVRRGGMPSALDAYMLSVLKKREENRPKDKARERLFQAGNTEIKRQVRVIREAFAAFNVHDVIPADVASFVDQWEGRRLAAVFKSRLSQFFAWACRKGLRTNNPAREISVEKGQRRMRYLTHDEFHKIRDAIMIGEDGRPTPSGPMVQCYVDLVYLTMQRPTEIRLLKWSDVREADGVIFFRPTKTEKSSGASVEVAITPEIKAVLDRARGIGRISSFYVIHTLRGKPYTTAGIGEAWDRARGRAGIKDATIRDLRAKAITDAKKAGFQLDDIRVAAAHTNANVTKQYIKTQETQRSAVSIPMPPKPEVS